MLQAYMDESGTHDGSHNSVIGGYWGSVNEWKKFERDWKAVLDLEGVEEFHAKDFWQRISGIGRVGIYKNWSDEKHRRFIGNLLSVIGSRKIYPFACGVISEDWANVPVDRKILFTGTDRESVQKSYLLPLHRIVVKTAGYCHAGKTMHFIADDNEARPDLCAAMTASFMRAKQWLSEVGDPAYEHVGSFGFENSKITYPLQAANLLAYEAHHFAKLSSRHANYKMRIEYMRALIRFKSRDDFWSFEENRFANMDAFIRQATEESEEMRYEA